MSSFNGSEILAVGKLIGYKNLSIDEIDRCIMNGVVEFNPLWNGSQFLDLYEKLRDMGYDIHFKHEPLLQTKKYRCELKLTNNKMKYLNNVGIGETDRIALLEAAWQIANERRFT